MIASRRPVSAATAVAALSLALLGPAAGASPPDAVDYVALGDSFAAGSGASAPGLSYPARLDGRARIDLIADATVPGATATSLLAGQLEALEGNADLVTVQVGGNDMRWFSLVSACLLSTDAACQLALGASSAAVTTVLPFLLRPVYESVAALEPDAQVLVVGYPRLFSPEIGGPLLEASVAEQEAMNSAAGLLNRVIATTAAEYGFEFVDVTARFEGHEANSEDPWLHGMTGAAFHPNDAGYEAYAAALTAAQKPGRNAPRGSP